MEYINLLNNGLNSDSDPSLQPQNTYRRGRNGTLVSKGDNHYAFESLEGNVVNFSLPEHKTASDYFTPIGWFRLGNRLVIHSAADKTGSGGPGEIGIVTFDNSGNGTYSALYYHEDLNYTQAKMISGYGLEENDRYHRIYWTDNFNQPRTVNLANPIFTTYYTGVGDLTIGETYMVLTDSIGYVTHAANIYGPQRPLGNVFTATGVNYTATGSVKVIKYLDVKIFDYTPEKMQGNIDFVKYSFGGNLYAGVKLYAYRVTTLDGYESAWSYLTNPIHVSSSNPILGHPQYEGRGGGGVLVNTTKYIELAIDNIPTYFDNIEVAVVEIDQKLDTVRNIEVFWIGAITGTTMTIRHYGQENLKALTIDDLGLYNAIIVKAKDIATLKQRQILANLTTREELTWTPSGVTVASHVYTMPCDDEGLETAGAGHSIYYATDINLSTGVTSGNILPGGHYVVRGTGTVTYNAVVYNVGETFVGVDNVLTYTTTGSPIVKACIRIKKYDKFAGGQEYQIIDLEDEYFDYRSMASHRYLKGYWRNETYRIGVLFWDLFGQPYFVRWLDDVTIPSQSDASGNYALIKQYLAGTQDEFALNVVGLTIDGIDITSIADKISGISIVRCERDATILGQGLLMQNVIKDPGLGDPNVIVPISTVIPLNDHHVAAGLPATSTTEFTWNLLGPEFDFDKTEYNISLLSGDYLYPVSDLSPLTNGGNPFGYLGVDEQVFTKYYDHNRYSGNTNGISYIMSLDEYEIVSSFIPGYTYKNHDIATAGTHPSAASAGAASLQQKAATGAQRTIVVCDTADFINGLNGNYGTGSDPAHSDTARKLLVNYVRPKSPSTLYGGTSDTAKANNQYILCNHYLPITPQLLADIDDGAGNYVLNGIEVYGGDCFVNIYERVSSMYDHDYVGKLLNNGSYSWGIMFPVESKYNTALREGRKFTDETMHNSATGIQYKGSAGQKLIEQFTYNLAYSSENNELTFPALPYNFQSISRYPYMARYSELKNLGETIDNMRVFKVNNFKNVDALHGEINNVRVSFDRLFYWQDKGIGYLPINERETISSALGGAVQLGVGGVMERYDTLGKYYGNQHQFGLVETNDGWVWFDMRRKAFMFMTYNGQSADIGIVKGLQSFFDNAFPTDTGFGNIYRNDTPLLGLGIIGFYDAKETVFLTFKSFAPKLSPATLDYEDIADFTIVYSVPKRMFIGITDLSPGNCIEHNGYVYQVKESRYAIVNTVVYTVGMTVSKNGITYVCIQEFTASGAANEEPDFVGSVYWVATSQENQVFIHSKGDICKFFGIVYPYELEVSSNGTIQQESAFDNVEVYGNDTALTDVYYENTNQVAQDTDIDLKNRNFRYIDNSWWFNTALENNKARLVDHYLRVKVVVKNYLTNPTVSLNKLKRIVYLKTIYRKKQ